MIEIDHSWTAFSGVHGGLVAAWLVEKAPIPPGQRPVSASLHYLSPVGVGPAEFDVTPVAVGRSTSSTLVALRQGKPRVTGLVRSARPGAAPDRDLDRWSVLAPVGGPDPLELDRLELPLDFVPFGVHLDIRPLTVDRPGGRGPRPELDVWMSLIDPAEQAALGWFGTAAVLADALPPGMFARWSDPRPVPTIDLTVHLAPERDTGCWFHVVQRTTWSDGRQCVDDTEIRDRQGALVAQARQTRVIL